MCLVEKLIEHTYYKQEFRFQTYYVDQILICVFISIIHVKSKKTSRGLFSLPEGSSKYHLYKSKSEI